MVRRLRRSIGPRRDAIDLTDHLATIWLHGAVSYSGASRKKVLRIIALGQAG
jgi:hypothetical protein